MKIVAGYHQYHAVRHAVERTIAATGPDGNRRIGVIWHTQGSGKSLLMAFYAGQIIAHPGDGESDRCRHHRPQRPRRPVVRHVFHVPRSAPPDPAAGGKPGGFAEGADAPFRRRGVHDHPEVCARVRRARLPNAHRSPQRRCHRRRSASQPVRLPRQGGTKDRRHLIRLRQAPARRPAERLLHRLHPARRSNRRT